MFGALVATLFLVVITLGEYLTNRKRLRLLRLLLVLTIYATF
jgi:hypothetical protein